MVLKKNISTREGVRIQLKSVIEKLSDCLADENSSRVKLLGLRNNLTNLVEKHETLDAEIVGQLQQDLIENDVLQSLQILEPTHELLAEVTLKLQNFEVSSVSGATAGSTSSKTIRCKLPKFELEIFKGDALAWQGFWDQFQSAIHDNEEISDIDRFNYLKRYLGGLALESVSGLTLSSANYKEAIAILKERFGNPQILISAHMDALIKVEKVNSKSDVKRLRKLYNKIESCIRNLSALKLNVSTYGMLLIPLLKEKLPGELNIIISRKFGSEVWSLDKLLQFFNEELIALENCVPVSSNASKEETKNKFVYSASSFHAQSNSHEFACLYCESKDHSSNQCKSVTNIRSRKDIIRKKSRCFICLKSGHLAKQCPSSYRCKKCNNGRHHVSICENFNRMERQPGLKNNYEVASKCPQGEVTQNGHISSSHGILLQTATVEVTNVNNDSRFSCERMMFDSGSQRSYISAELREFLGLETVRKEKIVIKTFGMDDSSVKILDVVQFKVKHKFGNRSTYVEALCVPFVCSDLTRQNISAAKRNYGHIQNLRLADSNENSSNLKVNILIGVDYYHCFFTGKVKKANYGPVASETVFGWVLSGRVEYENAGGDSFSFATHAMRCNNDQFDCLKLNLTRFWEVEALDNNETDSVVHEFEKHIYHDGKRYVTQLPFKPCHDVLPDNFSVCQKRLELTRSKLKKQGILNEYNQIFSEYQENGIIERVPDNEIPKEIGSVHYLPHRAVVRKDKSTTKIRAVFDASCATNGPSLNDCLYSGPNLISKIFDILLRFRLNRIAIIADIKQAFLNIAIEQSHCDYLRFLWYDFSSEPENIVVYRFLRVVFGVTSSPFLLNGTIRQHLNQYSKSHSEFVRKFEDDLYVDDTVSGVNTVDEGKQFYETATQIMQQAGFSLRKWVSNHPELQRYFDKQDKVPSEKEDDRMLAESEIVGVRETQNQKILGLDWNKDSDEIVFNFSDFLSQCRRLEPTKRNILSLCASLFDPLGLISPITAQIKVIFQKLCVEKISWDELITPQVKCEWLTLLKGLEMLEEIKINRIACFEKASVLSVELHGFCDSSSSLYCAVVYARVTTPYGINVYFWCSKTKVAPLKKLTIPRLELLGCLLLSKLIESVTIAIENKVKVDRVVCWTDSKIALFWIKGKEKTWKPWVENRVVLIRKVVPREFWFHIAGRENPADSPTRPIGDFKVLFNEWFHGPRFLCRQIDCVSFSENLDSVPEVQTEQIKSSCKKMTERVTLNCVTTDCDNDLDTLLKFENHSSLQKLLNVFGYVLRFKNNLIARVKQRDTVLNDEVLSVDELNVAWKKIIKYEQFKLKKQTNYEKMKASLRLFTDEEGYIRLRGRFANSTLTNGEKYPIILRSVKSYVTKLIVLDCHRKVMHHGIETTLSRLRLKYWIVQGRRVVKDVLKKCVTCRRFQGRPMVAAASPDLPTYRVNHLGYAFEATGLDFAGPLFIRNCKDSSKVYILLLTCASSRAIHLELTHDMKSQAFIRAIKRFIARRGVPNQVIHDNFKTFRSVEVKKFFSNSGIKQTFILPASPWWGGFYERLVRVVKTTLRKVLARSLLTFEELQTVLCEAEGVINQRPLHYSSEEDIYEALTPNHLIYGKSLSSLTIVHKHEPEQLFSSDECHKRAKFIQNLLRHYWKQFSTSYLNELRQHNLYRKSVRSSSEKLQLGDVVIVKEDNPVPRSQWRMGKVEKIIYGRDGHQRGAQLKVMSRVGKSTVIHRPLQKLIPFEISDHMEDISEKNKAGDNVNDVDTDVNTTDTEAAHDLEHIVHRNLPRRSAINGQLIRRLRDGFVN